MANKIAIGMACQDTIKTKTAFSLIHSLRYAPFEYDFFVQMSCDLIGNRVRLIRQAIEGGFTHLLFVDHDVFFPPRKGVSVITRLLEQEKDIIGAPYNFRSLPLKSTAFPVDGEDLSKPYRCHAIPTGLMLINLKIFEKIPEPWIQFGRDAKGNMVHGEDAFLCQKAIEHGFEVWADPTLDVKHIGDYEF